MAELHVQRKQSNNWWVWVILAIIIIAGALYYYTNYYQKNNHDGYNSKNAITDSSSSPIRQDTTIQNSTYDSSNK